MVAPFTWGSVGTVMNLLTTQLNSLATATLCSIGPEINNTSGYQQGQIYVSLASAAFVAGNYISIYLVPSSDTAGGAYPTFTSAAAAGLANYLAGTIYINGSTAAQKEILTDVRIPLGRFKGIALPGGSCPTLASSGDTVALYPPPTQY